MEYEIKLSAFNGPMDLLLHLIQKNEIDIYDIPIAELTQQYINYIESQEMDIEFSAEFLVMAAKLIQIKSRMILPTVKATIESDDEDAENLDDPREELMQRLLKYQQFQKLSEVLYSMLESEEKFVKRAPLELSKKVLPLENLSVEKLLKAFSTAMAAEENLTIPQVLVEAENFHVKDQMSEILSRLEAVDRLKLSEVIKTESINEIVTTFLALLELVKRDKVTAEQLMPFEEIFITKYKEQVMA
ncbi:MAG: segregation/condensation protein A [Selenomonadaceae bacterium]|nr:segregation/condensation protein A [Selenomonadaceae bacterium]